MGQADWAVAVMVVVVVAVVMVPDQAGWAAALVTEMAMEAGMEADADPSLADWEA